MRTARLRGACIGAAALLAVLLSGCRLAPVQHAPLESGIVLFSVPTARGPLAIRSYIPEQGSERAPVWVVMHGQRRDGENYFQAWLEHARALRAILVVPEFDKDRWPTAYEYPLGNVMTRRGMLAPLADSGFAAVDRAVEETLRRAARAPDSARIALYGHGAGAQFVQRYVLQTDTRRVSLAIAAAAGWYLLPEKNFDFPYGLRDLPLPDVQLPSTS